MFMIWSDVKIFLYLIVYVIYNFMIFENGLDLGTDMYKYIHKYKWKYVQICKYIHKYKWTYVQIYKYMYKYK